MSLSAENAEILERAVARAHALLEADPSLRRSMPSLQEFQQVVDRPTSIEIVLAILEAYAERPAIGYRQHELVLDEATGKRLARALPAFETISYRQLGARVARLASGLARAGVAAGELILLVGFTTVDHLVAELACHYLGAVSVPLARNVPARELEQIAAECQSTTWCCSVDQLARIIPSLRACASVERLVVLDVVDGDEGHLQLVAEACAAAAAVAPGPSSIARPVLDLSTIRNLELRGERAGLIPPAIPRAGTDPLISLVYTSGSTGAPKGAMLGERSWHARWSTLPFLELTSLPMVSVVFLPQNHMGGRNALANSLKLGGLAYLTHQSDMSTLFEDLRLVRPTYVHLVPRLSEMIHQHYQSELARRGADADAAALEAELRASFLGGRMLLALTASAPTPPEVLAFVRRCFDIPIVNVFAGTEVGQLLVDGAVNRHNVLAFQLVSVPELGYLESDQPYPRGELLVKTARGITGYFKNEQATRELLDASGFLRTGDIFEQRGPDELVWIDRKSHVVKLAQGEFVNLWRLEGLLASGSRYIHQIYLQASSSRSHLLAVIVPELGELPDAERGEGNEANEADEVGEANQASPAHDPVRALLRAELHRLARVHQLAPYELPREFLVEREPFGRDNGLLTSLGKPARPRLKQKYGPALEQRAEELEARQRADLGDGPAVSEGADGEAASLATQLRRTFAAALGLAEPDLDLFQSFRELGGDSIAATNLGMRVERRWGVRFSVGALLGPDTSLDEMLSEVLAAVEARGGGAAPDATSIFARIHGPDPQAIYARDLRLDRFFPSLPARPAAIPPRGDAPLHVLLTGATGFLGRFLCLALLERAAATGGRVTALVRGRTDVEAFGRLAEVYGVGSPLQRHFLTLAAEHLHVVAGDLERVRFGWAAERHAELAERVDLALHAAALVNHALPYDQLFEANVLGTAEVLRFCVSGRRKRCGLISTSSLALALLGEGDVARERDDTRALGDGWPARRDHHADGYRLSKWAAEVLAQDASERHGVPVDVFRCNLILPPARFRGQVNTGDFFARLICSVAQTGLRPASFYERGEEARPHLDGLPVDFLAAAIVDIAASPSSSSGHAVYHLNNVHWGDGVSLDTVMDRLEALGFPLERVDDHATWFQRFEGALRAQPPVAQAASSLPILAQWRAPLQPARRQRIDASAFRAQVAALRPAGLADIPSLGDDYLDRCIDDLRSLGLIAGP